MISRATGVGRYLPSSSGALRPAAAVELAAYGGAPLFRGKWVADVGTGDGRLALGMARWAREVVALDPDPDAIRSARANARRLGLRNVSFRIAAAQDLPLRDASLDAVVLSWAL